MKRKGVNVYLLGTNPVFSRHFSSRTSFLFQITFVSLLSFLILPSSSVISSEKMLIPTKLEKLASYTKVNNYSHLQLEKKVYRRLERRYSPLLYLIGKKFANLQLQ